MPIALSQRFLKAFAAQGFSQIINLFIQLLSVPLLLKYWGKDVYGQWLILSTIPAYFSISDLGFGTATAIEMTLMVARGDKEGALRVFNNAWFFIILFSSVCSGMAILPAYFFPAEKWFHLTSISHAEFIFIVIILLMQIAVSQQVGLLHGAYQCDGLYSTGIMIHNILRLVEFISLLIIAFLSSKFIVVSSFVLFMKFVGLLIFWHYIKYRQNWLQIKYKNIKWRHISYLLGSSLAFNSVSLSWALSLQGMMTICGLMFGPTAVVTFSTARTLTRIAWQAIYTVSMATSVEISRSFGANNKELSRFLHRKSGNISFWFSLFVIFTLLFSGKSVYGIWTHGAVKFNQDIFHILLIGVFISSLWTSSFTAISSVNRHQKISIYFVLVTFFCLVLGWILALSFGINGIALASVVSEVVMLIFTMRSAAIVFDDRIDKYLKSLFTWPFKIQSS